MRSKLNQLSETFSTTSLAETVGDLLLLVQAGDLVVIAAAGDEEVLAGNPERLLGLNLAFAFSDRVAVKAEAAIQTLKSGHKPDAIRARLRRLDGRLSNVTLHPALTTDENNIAFVVRSAGSGDEELSRTNRLLDAIIENIPIMLFLKDAETLTFRRVNKTGEELLGMSRQQLLAKSDYDLYPAEQADHFRTKDRETLKHKRLVEVEEEPIEVNGGGLRWLHTKKVPILDEHGEPLYLLGISEDVTARKAAEDRAHSLDHQLASIIQAAPAAVITWKEDGEIVSWNPGAEKLYGITEREALGRSFLDFVPESERGEFLDRQDKALRNEPTPTAAVYRVRRGFEFEVDETLFAIPAEGGNPQLAGCIARDGGELARLRRAAETMSANQPLPTTINQTSRMEQTLAMAVVVAEDSNATVLLHGENGVGKGWLARYIHNRSGRVKHPFLEVNCTSLGPKLVECELFGHEAGAVPGATAQKRGLVEAADGGTLLLSEVGDLPLDVQAQLLTFLDSKSFRRVGGNRTLTADVRILAATNRDLKAQMEDGLFRRDLYYRLSVIPLPIPPLREHLGDIPELCQMILADIHRRSGKERPVELKRRAMTALQRYHWPGNVRELRNVLERACILSRGAYIGVEHLSLDVSDPAEIADRANASLAEIEHEHIHRVLESVSGNRTRAAEILGISRSTLKRKLASR